MEFISVMVMIIAVIVVQVYIYRHFAFKNFTYTCRFDKDEADEGDELQLIETIVNRKWLPLPWLKSEITTSRWLDFAGSQSVVTERIRFVPSFFMVKSYQKVARTWKVKCLKRGVFGINRAILISTDLLGFASLSQPVDADASVTVFPAPYETPELLISPQYLSGDVVVKRHLLTDPFYIAGVREYQEGDPMNKIHWRVTAKERRLMVFHNDSTSRQSLTVILNVQSRDYEITSTIDERPVEDAIKVCAYLFEQTIPNQTPLSFMANGNVDGSRQPIATNEYWGEQHVHNLKALLAGLILKSTDTFPVFLNDIYDAISTTDIAIVTAYLNDEILDFARRKMAGGTEVRIIVMGALDAGQLPDDCAVYCLYDNIRKEAPDEKA